MSLDEQSCVCLLQDKRHQTKHLLREPNRGHHINDTIMNNLSGIIAGVWNIKVVRSLLEHQVCLCPLWRQHSVFDQSLKRKFSSVKEAETC